MQRACGGLQSNWRSSMSDKSDAGEHDTFRRLHKSERKRYAMEKDPSDVQTLGGKRDARRVRRTSSKSVEGSPSTRRHSRCSSGVDVRSRSSLSSTHDCARGRQWWQAARRHRELAHLIRRGRLLLHERPGPSDCFHPFQGHRRCLAGCTMSCSPRQYGARRTTAKDARAIKVAGSFHSSASNSHALAQKGRRAAPYRLAGFRVGIACGRGSGHAVATCRRLSFGSGRSACLAPDRGPARSRGPRCRCFTRTLQ